MNTVFLKTRELGQAILASEEYKLLKEAEDKATKNAEAAQIMGEYIEKKNEVQGMLAVEKPDTEALKRLSDEMDACQEKLQSIEDIVALTQARATFTNLIEQVNQVLRFIVTGEMPGGAEESEQCGGSCSTCGGCGHHHLN